MLDVILIPYSDNNVKNRFPVTQPNMSITETRIPISFCPAQQRQTGLAIANLLNINELEKILEEKMLCVPQLLFQTLNTIGSYCL